TNQPVERGRTWAVETERSGDRGDEGGVVHADERDDARSGGEPVRERGDELEGEARLTDACRTGQREQARPDPAHEGGGHGATRPKRRLGLGRRGSGPSSAASDARPT